MNASEKKPAIERISNLIKLRTDKLAGIVDTIVDNGNNDEEKIKSNLMNFIQQLDAMLYELNTRYGGKNRVHSQN